MKHSGRIDSRLSKIEAVYPGSRKPSSTKCEVVVRWLADVLDAFPLDLARSGRVVWKRPSEAIGLVPEVPYRRNSQNLHLMPGDDPRPYHVPIESDRLAEIRTTCHRIVVEVRAGRISDLGSLLEAVPRECQEALHIVLGKLIGRW